jgi:serine phosphatase RsbU (regulator of sigma subunit)
VNPTRRRILVFLMLLAHLPAAGQVMYWQDPVVLASGALIRHTSSSSAGGLMAVAWQELTPRDKSGLEGKTTVVLTTTADGTTWSKPNRSVYPDVSYRVHEGGVEPRVYSMTVDRRGRVLVAVARSDRGIAVMLSTDAGRTFEPASLVGAGEVLVAPSLFESAAGGFILLAARASGAQAAERVVLVFSTSADGRRWSDFSPLVTADGPGAGLQLQPDHAAFGGKDFVVFQAPGAGQGDLAGQQYQLYITSSSDAGLTWQPPRAITTGPAFKTEANEPAEFSNQRPRLTALPDGLALAWERNPQGREGSPEIFFCRIGTDGRVAGGIEKVSSGAARFARIVAFRGKVYLLYAEEGTSGPRVMLEEHPRRGDPEQQDTEGSSQFPHAAILGDSLYLFWERESGSATALVERSPDTTVATPTLAFVDPRPGGYTRASAAAIQWNRVEDRAGVKEYRYSWTFSDGVTTVTKKSGTVPGRESARLASQVDTDRDGTWTFSVTAVDGAGNVSAPLTVTFLHDGTAPGPVQFVGFAPGVVTPLSSNDVDLVWARPSPDVAAYRWDGQRLAGTEEEYRAASPQLRVPSPDQVVLAESKSFRNLENGIWAFTVQAVDAAGNLGPASTVLALLAHFKPLAVIWGVRERVDQLGSVSLEIRGKGFLSAGRVEQVVLDRDGKPPFDLTFAAGSGFDVVSDGRIDGPRLTNSDPPGLYRVGIVHPTRGVQPWFYPGYAFNFRSPGTVKIGNFEIALPRWGAREVPGITVSTESLLVVALVALLAVLIVLGARRVAAIAREGAVLTAEVTALIEGRPSAGMQGRGRRDKRMKELQRKGMGLRLKFTLLVVVLVILVVLIVAVPLGYQMTNNQQTVLASGLQKQSEILIGSLAASAAGQLRLEDLGYSTVWDIPAGRAALPEALYATVSGPAGRDAKPAPDANRKDYLWASDEKKLKERRDNRALDSAVEPVDDELARAGLPAALRKEVDTALRGQLASGLSDYNDLSRQLDALRSSKAPKDRQDAMVVRMAQKAAELDRMAASKLSELHPFRSHPDFDVRTRADTYVFYYPIVYFVPADSSFFQGMVRLAVATGKIQAAIRKAQVDLVTVTGLFALLAVALGVAGAIILANITITPIRRLVKGVAQIRDTEDKEDLKNLAISVGTRDEIGLLAETVNEMSQGLARAAAANKMLLLGKDVQKMFLPLEKDAQGRKKSTAEEDADQVEIYGYYEGAKGVSGDFFDFRKLDDSHYAFIKSDASGKGVPAALIMVEVATLFINYFRDWQKRKANIQAITDARGRQRALAELQRVDTLVYTINDMVAEREFKGMFATLLVGVLDTDTGIATLCHAGDSLLHFYESASGKMIIRQLPPGTAAGVFHSKDPVMKASFSQVTQPLASGDALFLFTDGYEEAKRHFYDAGFKPVACAEPGLKAGDEHLGHKVGEDSELFGVTRIEGVVTAVFHRQTYMLERCHVPTAEELTFDFSKSAGNVRDAVLAVTAVEKVFRLIPDPSAGPDDRVVVDAKLDQFLRAHFLQYEKYFSHRVEAAAGPYVSFTHLREDEQYDDLTIVVIRRK